MSPTNATKNSCNYKALLFLVTYSTATALLVFSPKSDAGEWVFVPRIVTSVIFTDNVSLAPKGDPNKESDVIFRLTPGFYSKISSRRFNSEIDYQLNNIIYVKNSERNRSLHMHVPSNSDPL